MKMNETMIMKLIKNIIVFGSPHTVGSAPPLSAYSSESLHSNITDLGLMESNIISCQDSPVDILNSVSVALPKFLKLA